MYRSQLSLCRSRYVGRVFTLMAEAGSALVRVVSIENDTSVNLVRCNRASAADILVLPLSTFLEGVERGIFVACR
jgi:hypothetical protein